MANPKPVVLCILDGWGLNPDRTGNAVMQANTPNFDRVMATCPNATLTACGEAVGLPEGQMGNSEVGHMNIGAGRIVWMDLPKINRAIEDGSFASNAALQAYADKVIAAGGVAHVAGLVSDGGVHAHSNHIVAAAQVLAGRGLRVAVHAFTDGRDVAPTSADKFLTDLEARLPAAAFVATISGRFFAMDRDNRWERVGQAVDAVMRGKGTAAQSAADAIAAATSRGETDEFISPSVIGGYEGMKDGDGLLFVNFRADRAREILAALLDPAFDGYDIGPRPALSAACGMVEYSDNHNAYMDVMYPSEEITNTLGAWVAAQGKSQFRLAETEKYPHVTFFFNGGKEVPNSGEDRYMAPSPKVKTYDLQPEMSSAEVTEQLVGAIQGQKYDMIIVNYANPDMVGHTGDLQAAIAACESVDRGLGATLAALDDVGGAMIVTADHGNCDMMIDPDTGGPHTAHTLFPVPVAIVGAPAGSEVREGGVLADLAPTVLALMGLPQPAEMTGQSLLR